jgi:GDP-L-fucose synthase
MLMNENSRIYIAGHRGMVGSAIWRELQRQGFKNLIGKSRHEVDLLDASAVYKFFAAEKPEFFFDAAAKVGGIHANNSLPAEYENLEIQNHLIHAAWRRGFENCCSWGAPASIPKWTKVC